MNPQMHTRQQHDSVQLTRARILVISITNTVINCRESYRLLKVAGHAHAQLHVFKLQAQGLTYLLSALCETLQQEQDVLVVGR